MDRKNKTVLIGGAVVEGITGRTVGIEVEAARAEDGGLTFIGLLETSERETRVRIRSALSQCGINLDGWQIRVTVEDLGGAASGSLDLPIAVGIASAVGATPERDGFWAGELSLTGQIRHVRGLLPMLAAIKAQRVRGAWVPMANSGEAWLLDDEGGFFEVKAAADLQEILSDKKRDVFPLTKSLKPEVMPPEEKPAFDMSEIMGQYAARYALEIAAAGGHGLLVVGPPGGGKTMLAQRMTTILPKMTQKEALEVTAIQSAAGLRDREQQGIVTTRPFRAPHHTCSTVGLMGGGRPVRPGEATLAAGGVLFLDALPEFRGEAVRAVTRASHEGEVTIRNGNRWHKLPAGCQIVASAQPCACGYHGDPSGCCKCSKDQVKSFAARLGETASGICDMKVTVPPVDVATLRSAPPAEDSATIRARVDRAREVQRRRYDAGEADATTNARLSPKSLARVAVLDGPATTLFKQGIENLRLTENGRRASLRCARTIADLEGSDVIGAPHIAAALCYRVDGAA